MKKNALAAGLAFGIYYAVALFIIGISARTTGYCKIFVAFMSTFYKGYNYTLVGSFIGLGRGFVDGFIGAFIIVRLYSRFHKKLK